MLSRRLKATSTEVADFKAEKITAAEAQAKAEEQALGQPVPAMRGDEREHLRTAFGAIKSGPK